MTGPGEVLGAASRIASAQHRIREISYATPFNVRGTLTDRSFLPIGMPSDLPLLP